MGLDFRNQRVLPGASVAVEQTIHNQDRASGLSEPRKAAHGKMTGSQDLLSFVLSRSGEAAKAGQNWLATQPGKSRQVRQARSQTGGKIFRQRRPPPAPCASMHF